MNVCIGFIDTMKKTLVFLIEYERNLINGINRRKGKNMKFIKVNEITWINVENIKRIQVNQQREVIVDLITGERYIYENDVETLLRSIYA